MFFFQIIINTNCQQFVVPEGRDLHTATLIGTNMYFLGGRLDFDKYSNDFFCLDVAKLFGKRKKVLPFIKLSASDIPPHHASTTSVFGRLKSSIFFFGGDMGRFNDLLILAYLF